MSDRFGGGCMKGTEDWGGKPNVVGNYRNLKKKAEEKRGDK